MPRLQNLALDTIHDINNKFLLPTLTFRSIYESTASGSPLRQYITQLAMRRLANGDYAKHADPFPHEMLIDILTHIAPMARRHGYVFFDHKDFYVAIAADEH